MKFIINMDTFAKYISILRNKEMLCLNYSINNLDSTETLYSRIRYEDFAIGHHTIVEIVRSRVDGLGTPNTDTMMLAANSTNWDNFLARMFFDPSSHWGLGDISGNSGSIVSRITLTSESDFDFTAIHMRSDGNDNDGLGTALSQFGENKDASCVFDALITTAKLVSNLILSHNGVRAKKCGNVLPDILVPLIQREKEKYLESDGRNGLLTNLADRANISIILVTINSKRLMHVNPTRKNMAAVSWTSQELQNREMSSKHVPNRHRVFNIDFNRVTHMNMSLRAYRDHVVWTTHREVTGEDLETLMRKHVEDPWSNQINAINRRGGQLAAVYFKNIWLTKELTDISLAKIKMQCLEVRLGGHVAEFVKLACTDFLSWNMTGMDDMDWTTRPTELI